MSSPQILIVDDEPNVRFVLTHALKHAGYTLHTAANGAEALKLLQEVAIDLLLLDLNMEPIDGLAVFNAARQIDPHLTVIILTAYSSVESAVEALRLGAFDYLLKPASPHDIRQRVQAGLQQRRDTLHQQQVLAHIESLRQTLNTLGSAAVTPPPPALLRAGPLTLDTHRRCAEMNGHPLELTTTEFELLACLVQAAPKPVSPRRLVTCALGYNVDDVEARDIAKWHIHHLRQKIEPSPKKPQFIKTVRHQGYLWSHQ